MRNGARASHDPGSTKSNASVGCHDHYKMWVIITLLVLAAVPDLIRRHSSILILILVLIHLYFPLMLLS
jgi:hypothetical protein